MTFEEFDQQNSISNTGDSSKKKSYKSNSFEEFDSRFDSIQPSTKPSPTQPTAVQPVQPVQPQQPVTPRAVFKEAKGFVQKAKQTKDRIGEGLYSSLVRNSVSMLTDAVNSYNKLFYGKLLGGKTVTGEDYDETFQSVDDWVTKFEEQTYNRAVERLGEDGVNSYVFQASQGLGQGVAQVGLEVVSPYLGIAYTTALMGTSGKDAYERAIEAGASERTAKLNGYVTGGVTALERLVPGGKIGSVAKKGVLNTLKSVGKTAKLNGYVTGGVTALEGLVPGGKIGSVAKKGVLNTLKSVGKSVGKTAFFESVTEGIQDFVTSGIAYLTYDKSEEPFKQAINSFLVSIPTGVLFGGVNTAQRKIKIKKAKKQIVDEAVKQGVAPDVAQKYADNVVDIYVLTGDQNIFKAAGQTVAQGYEAAVEYKEQELERMATEPGYTPNPDVMAMLDMMIENKNIYDQFMAENDIDITGEDGTQIIIDTVNYDGKYSAKLMVQRPDGSVQNVPFTGLFDTREEALDSVRGFVEPNDVATLDLAFQTKGVKADAEQKTYDQNQEILKAFDKSEVIEDYGNNIVIGTVGQNAFKRKVDSKDRFPLTEIKETLENIGAVYRASNDKNNYRYDNMAIVSQMPNGEKRVIYTRKNKAGNEEIINAHVITNNQYLLDLEKNGVPERTRTSNLFVRTDLLYPLSYGDNKSISQNKTNSKTQTKNEANEPTSEEMDMLKEEAKKYKSSEEFVKAYKKIPDYAMTHRPDQSGSGYNIDEFGNAPDFYDNPRFFKHSDDGTYDESISALLKIKNKPEAIVTVYRASPKENLNFGDWISLSKKYAKQESLSENTKVHSFKVKAKDIQFAGDDINEFGYYPTDETIKDMWVSLQPKTNNPKDYKSSNDFIDAMYEKGIFKDIESSQKRWEKEMQLEQIWKQANEPIFQEQITTPEFRREALVADLDKILKRLKLNLDVKFVDSIITPELEQAWGVYFDGTIAFSEMITDTTFIHEVGHAIFKNIDKIPLFKGITRQELYTELRKEFPTLDNYNLEEKLMDKLEDFYRKYELQKPTGVTGKVKQFLQRLYLEMKKMFKARTAIQDFIERATFGEAKEVTNIPTSGMIEQYSQGKDISFEGFERPMFLNERVSQQQIQKEFDVLFKKKEPQVNVEIPSELKQLKTDIIARSYQKQGLEAIRNNIPPKERYRFMERLSKVGTSGEKYISLLQDVYQRKSEIDIAKGESKVTAIKRRKIGYLRMVNNLDQALIRDIKETLGFRDVYLRGEKKGLPKKNLTPITKMTNEQLDQVIAEIEKRIAYRKAKGYANDLTTDMVSVDTARKIGEVASKQEKSKVKAGVKDAGRAVGRAMKNLGVTLENRLGFAPEIYRGMIGIENSVKEYLNNVTDTVKGFVDTYKKLSKGDRRAMDLMLFSQNYDGAIDLLTMNGLDTTALAEIKTTLDDLYAKLTSVGIDVGYLKDYFPRYLKEMYQNNPDAFMKALNDKQSKQGRDLNNEEVSNLTATYLRGFSSGGRILLSDGRFAESRMIDNITDPAILEMYESAPTSLEKYIEQAIQLYEEKKFFNKLDPKLTQDLANKDYERAITTFVERKQAEGGITQKQADELREVISAYFFVGQNMQLTRIAMNLGMVLTLAKITSGIPQVLETSQYILTNKLSSSIRGFMNFNNINLKDVLVDTFFEANEMDLNKVMQTLTMPMRVGDLAAGIAGVNILMQEGITDARNGTQEIKDKFNRLFGEQGDQYLKEFAQLPRNIKGKDLPRYAKDFLNSEMRRYRVTGRLEKSATFIKNPQWGFLKSFTVKMANEIVKRGNQQIAMGVKKKDPALFIEGLRKKSGLLLALVASGASSAFIRDVLRGNETDETEDYVWTAFLQLFMVSYYGINNFERLGPWRFLIDMFAPATVSVPMGVVDNLYRDIKKDADKRSFGIEDYKIWRSVPIAGDVIQYLQNTK